MSEWSCNLSKNVDLTVGEKVTLACEGSTEGVVQESLVIKDAQLTDQVPAMTLLAIQKFEPTSSEFIVTSYRTGEHTADQIAFYDGKTKITVKGFDWKLKSVLKQDPANPPQAFGSFPMMELSYPIWFWILLIAILAAAFGLPYLQFKRIESRKKAFDDLKNLETALNPLDAFFKSMRRIEKALEVDHISPRGFIDQVDKDWRIFLSRSMQFPAHLWATRETLKEIKKRYPRLYRDHGDDIKKYFSEFAKSKDDVQKKDCIYLMTRTQSLAEIVDEGLAQKTKRRL